MSGNGPVREEGRSGECLYGCAGMKALKRLFVACLCLCNKVKLLFNKVAQEFNKDAQICTTLLHFCITKLHKSLTLFTDVKQMGFPFFDDSFRGVVKKTANLR